MAFSNIEDRKNALIESLLDRHYIFDAAVEAAFRRVSMEDFLPEEVREYAYLDQPLPFARNGRPMAAPHIDAIFLQLLQLEPAVSYNILQISSMSGYFAALMNAVSEKSQINIIEVDPEIVQVTEENLSINSYDSIKVTGMDPVEAFWEFPESNRIVFCAAVSSSIVDKIAQEMPNNSVLIAPTFMEPRFPIDQEMLQILKSKDGAIEVKSFGKVSFIILESASVLQKEAFKTQELIFKQVGQITQSLEDYFTSTLPREAPLLRMNIPEHIIEDFITANTLHRKGFKKAAIFEAALAVKESIQYFIETLLDFSKLAASDLRSQYPDLLSDEELRDFETMLDIEKSIINYDYENPPDIDRLADMALDIASNFLETKFKDQ
jgi:protein-L-isoaspartate(D-aspartate) O-methyltransferase